MKVDKFWIVYRVVSTGNGYSCTRHSSRQGAFVEAERLAATHPGEVFVLLEATRACRAEKPVTWVDCGAPPESKPVAELTGREVKLAVALRRISDTEDGLGGNLASDFATTVLRELDLGPLEPDCRPVPDGPDGAHSYS